MSFRNLKFTKIILDLATKAVQQHGQKVLDVNDIDALTKDLGDALRNHKYMVQNKSLLDSFNARDFINPVGFISASLEAGIDVVGPLIEIKLLTAAVAKKLDINTKGIASADILDEIVRKTEARGSMAAEDIKKTQEWWDLFSAHPDVREILEMDMTQIEMPKGLTDISGMGKTVVQTGTRVVETLKLVGKYKNAARKLEGLKAPEPEAPPPAEAAKPSRKKRSPKQQKPDAPSET